MIHVDTKSWQLQDGKEGGTIVTRNNRIIKASPGFQRYVGRLLATLPLTMKATLIAAPLRTLNEFEKLHINGTRQPDGRPD